MDGPKAVPTTYHESKMQFSRLIFLNQLLCISPAAVLYSKDFTALIYFDINEFHLHLFYLMKPVEYQNLVCLISARGEFWEIIFLKHKSILSIGRVPQARVLWTVWTSASGKCFPRILPVRKLHSLTAAIRSIWKLRICKIHDNLWFTFFFIQPYVFSFIFWNTYILINPCFFLAHVK